MFWCQPWRVNVSPDVLVSALVFQCQPRCFTSSVSPDILVSALMCQCQPWCFSVSPDILVSALMCQCQPWCFNVSPDVSMSALMFQCQPWCFGVSPDTGVSALTFEYQPWCFTVSLLFLSAPMFQCQPRVVSTPPPPPPPPSLVFPHLACFRPDFLHASLHNLCCVYNLSIHPFLLLSFGEDPTPPPLFVWFAHAARFTVADYPRYFVFQLLSKQCVIYFFILYLLYYCSNVWNSVVCKIFSSLMRGTLFNLYIRSFPNGKGRKGCAFSNCRF